MGASVNPCCCLSLRKRVKPLTSLPFYRRDLGIKVSPGPQSEMLCPLNSGRQKQADPRLFTALINKLPTHKSSSCNWYLWSLCPPPSPPQMVPSRLLLLSKGRSCIPNAQADLEPEEYLKRTSALCTDGTGEVSRGFNEGAKSVLNERLVWSADV